MIMYDMILNPYAQREPEQIRVVCDKVDTIICRTNCNREPNYDLIGYQIIKDELASILALLIQATSCGQCFCIYFYLYRP